MQENFPHQDQVGDGYNDTRGTEGMPPETDQVFDQTGGINLADGSEQKPQLVTDLDTAHAMAIAGDPIRSEAVEHRNRAFESNKKAEELEKLLKVKDGEIDTRSFQEKQAAHAAYGSEVEFAYSQELSAEWADKEADKVEEWARFLHEHPVSEEVAKANPGVDFSPYSMYLLEGKMEFDLDRVAVNRKILENLVSGSSIIGITTWIGTDHFYDISRNEADVPPRRPKKYDYALSNILKNNSTYARQSGVSERLGQMLQNPDTKIAELDGLHREVLEAVYVKPLENRAAIARNLIKAVRGEALDTAQSEN